MRRILVCGARDYRDEMRVYNELAGLKGEHGDFTVIHGNAPGADSLAEVAATRLGLFTEVHPARWEKYGPAAGPIRNRQMLDTKPDLVLAFHDHIERSRGTRDCVREAERRGIPTRIVAAPASLASRERDPGEATP